MEAINSMLDKRGNGGKKHMILNLGTRENCLLIVFVQDFSLGELFQPILWF